MLHNEFTIYGLKSYKSVINQIKSELNLEKSFFDIELILTEAITNAFQHGNKGDSSKAIKIAYELNNNKLFVEVQDCGEKSRKVNIPNKLCEETILDESGKGLYLIKCLCDNVCFCGNKIKVEKSLNGSV